MATDFQFRAGPHDEEELFVLGFTGREGLSQPFQYELSIGAQDVTIDFEEMIGAAACLTIATPQGDRLVHGIVSRWEETSPGRNWTTYRATLVPRLWALGLARDTRTFQNQSTPDIVKAVLTGAGLASDDFKLSLQGSYEPRIWCVQYAESNLAFLSRLLEEEGMFYFFEQTDEREVLVIGDTNDACVALEGEDQLAHREGDPGMLGSEQVRRLRYGRSLKVGSVSLFEYDFKKPTLRLEATEEDGDGEKSFASEDYPGEYPAQGLGDHLAAIRLEEQRAERYLGVGESDCRRLTPGWRFTLFDHPTDTLNQEYVILQVRHRGTQPQAGHGGGSGKDAPIYANHFECIPSSITFRPLRLTPRPHIDGVQTAVVVGPSGEEIHCDEYARVKVRFPWDRSGVTDDKASCWIRVSQQWGGAGWGGMQIPRIGQEVVVEYLEGDPDRPLITGRVFNGGSPVPYELPAQKVMATMVSSTSPGGASANELRLTDTSGSQELFTHASKDMKSGVENNRHLKVGVNETVSVGGDVTRDVTEKEDVTVVQNRVETVAGNQTITVKGNDNLEVKGAYSREIGSVRLRLIKGDSKLDVTGENGVSVGVVDVQLVKGESKREIDGAASMRTGLALIEAVKGDHTEETEDRHTVLAGGLVLKKTKGDFDRKSEGMVVFACPTLKIEADNIEISADTQIAMAVEGSGIVIKDGEVNIESDGITVKASGDWKGEGSSLPWN